jgi:hypothetical protein
MTRPVLCSILAATAATSVVPQYFLSGFTHILPEGLDHILFILALFFLSRSFSVLLFQLTVFTLGHSLTLGLALHGLVTVPNSIVEIAIALSISFVAIENLIFDRISRWRPWLVFGFGLIHGLGFAHTFRGASLSEIEFLPALFSYNLGIEAGQIVVIGLAYAAVAAWWKRDLYVKRISRTASTAIALIGFYWAVERCC